MNEIRSYRELQNTAKAIYDEQYAHPEIPMPDETPQRQIPRCHFCEYPKSSDTLLDAMYRGQQVKVCREHRHLATITVKKQTRRKTNYAEEYGDRLL